MNHLLDDASYRLLLGRERLPAFVSNWTPEVISDRYFTIIRDIADGRRRHLIDVLPSISRVLRLGVSAVNKVSILSLLLAVRFRSLHFPHPFGVSRAAELVVRCSKASSPNPSCEIFQVLFATTPHRTRRRSQSTSSQKPLPNRITGIFFWASWSESASHFKQFVHRAKAAWKDHQRLGRYRTRTCA